MADADRKEKLAAAKKRLKQFKQKAGRSSPSNPPQTNKTRSNGKDTDMAEEKQTVASDTSNNASELLPNSVIEPPKPTERIQQLSRQLNGEIMQPDIYTHTRSNELDSHHKKAQNSPLEVSQTYNQESVAVLETQKRENEQLVRQLQDMKIQSSKLQQSLDAERKGFDEKLKRELDALKDQLKVHIQTIGILVSEKTELQASLGQNQKMAEQRLEEVEELSGRLKASRQRVGDLEKSFTTISNTSKKHEKANKELSSEVDRLKLQLYKLNKGTDEYQQQNSELHNKLQTKSAECDKLEVDCIELRGQLEMAQLHVEQLQSGAVTAVDNDQVDRLVEEKAQLQAKLDQYEESFKKVSAEREQIASQYQQYIDQLVQQSQQLHAQVTGLVDERDELTTKQAELQAIITDLQQKQDSVSADVSMVTASKEQLSFELEALRTEYTQVTAKYDSLLADNAQLSSLLAEREAALLTAEQTTVELKQSHEDGERLLASVQSDRTALSRAVAQNKQLKERHCELEDKLVSLTNENAELLTSLQHEQHSARELAARLGQQEDELKNSREEVVVKEQQLLALQQKQQLLQQQQQQQPTVSSAEWTAEERLLDMQQQTTLLSSLQQELASAQDTINALSNQNNNLEGQLQEERHKTKLYDGTSNEENFMKLSDRIEQLEAERNSLKDELSSEIAKRDALQTKLDSFTHDLSHQAAATLNGDVLSRRQFEALQHAMTQLEAKYTKVMRDKADLTDKNDHLEHIVMQLQGETDTIGEYITLYQHQRHILKVKAQEKDNYISQMARDHEQMTEQLEQLRPLVAQLLGKEQMLHSYPHLGAVTPTSSLPRHQHTPHEKNKSFGATLDSSHLEDWPDYNSSGGESETSEVVAIVGSNDTMADGMAAMVTASNTPLSPKEQAAQQIMHLLDRLEYTNSADSRLCSQWTFLQCSHCVGKLIVV